MGMRARGDTEKSDDDGSEKARIHQRTLAVALLLAEKRTEREESPLRDLIYILVAIREDMFWIK